MPLFADKYPQIKKVVDTLNPDHEDGECVFLTFKASHLLTTNKIPDGISDKEIEEKTSAKICQMNLEYKTGSFQHGRVFRHEKPQALVDYLKTLQSGTVLSAHNEDHSYNILVMTEHDEDTEYQQVYLVDASFGVYKKINNGDDFTMKVEDFPDGTSQEYFKELMNENGELSFFMDGEGMGLDVIIEGSLSSVMLPSKEIHTQDVNSAPSFLRPKG